MSLKDIFNVQDINSSQTSIAKVLLVFYLIVASNYTDNLIAKQLKDFLDNNRLAQHVIGFLTMIVLVTLVGGVVDTRSAIVYSLIGYVWFIFSTKLDIHWNVVIITLLFVGYMYENSLGVRERQILDDPNLTAKHKREAIDKNNRYKTWIVGSVILVTIIGTIMYSHKKHGQYGGGYDAFTYLLY